MSSTEDARREQQRAAQALARKLQAEGKTKVEVRKATQALKQKRQRDTKAHSGSGRPHQRQRQGDYNSENGRNSRFGGNRDRFFGNNDSRSSRGGPRFGGPDRSRQVDYSQYETREEADKARKRDEMARKHDMVIIPIYWRKREEEATLVQDSAQDLKNKLMKHKVNTWIDQRTSLTPAQKYQYWESMGVMFRMELGPKEASTQVVTVSKASPEEGTLAERWHDLSTKTDRLHDLLFLLRDQGMDKLKNIGDADECEPCSLIQQEDKDKPSLEGRAASVAAAANRPNKKATKVGTIVASEGKHMSFSDDSDDGGSDDGGAQQASAGPSGDSLEGNYAL